MNIPSVNIVISVFANKLNGTNILINVEITINGPNGIYSSDFLILVTIRITPITAPIKNDIIEINPILATPKYSPNAPINFTSPSPNVSFLYIKLPITVIAKNIPAPHNIPNNKSIVIATLEIPYKNAITIPTSNIAKFNLFGIICNL